MLYYFLHFTLNKYAKTTLDTRYILDKNTNDVDSPDFIRKVCKIPLYFV